MKNYLLEGDLIAPLVEGLFRADIDLEIITPLRIPELNWRIGVGVVYRRDVPLPPAAAKLLDELRRTCAAYKTAP